MYVRAGGHRKTTIQKSFYSSCKAKAGHYTRKPINAISNSTRSRLKEVPLQSVEQNEIMKYAYVRLPRDCKELDTGIEIVHGCFMERGDSSLLQQAVRSDGGLQNLLASKLNKSFDSVRSHVCYHQFLIIDHV